MSKGSAESPVHESQPSSPPLENAPRRSALQSAIAHLRRGLRRDGTYEGVGEWDVSGHQWSLLAQWARSQGLSLPPQFIPEREGGREHDVRFDDASKRWFKFTKPSAAGYAVHLVEGRPLMVPAMPLQYLERWRLHNRLFFDDVRLIGLRTEGQTHRLVISQQDWGADIPDWEAMEKAMEEDYRLNRLPDIDTLGGYKAQAYMIKHTAVFDVRPLNCARSANGLIVPFDVIPQVFHPKEAAILREFH